MVWDKYERELFKPWSLRRKIVGQRIIKVKLSIYTYYLEKLFLQSHTCSTLYYYFSLSLLTYLKVSSIASICRTEVNHVFGSSSVKLLAKSAHEMDVHPHAKDHCFSKISIWKAKKGKISPLWIFLPSRTLWDDAQVNLVTKNSKLGSFLRLHLAQH